MGESANFFTDF